MAPGVAVVNDNSAFEQDVQNGRPSSPSDISTIRYNQYDNAEAIDYIPEILIAEGIKMLKAVEGGLKTLTIGNKMREGVWQREIER